MNKVLRTCAALVLLLALVIVVPLSLIALAGWPAPSKVPDVGNMMTMTRQNNIQADFVVKSIALMVWLAWLQLMAAVVWEVAVNVPRLLSGRRQRRAPLVMTPVANGVAKLFSMILTAGFLSTVVSQPAMALTNSQVSLSPNTSSISLESSRVALPVVIAANPMPEVKVASLWVAQGNDSLWDIAEQALGDGSEVSLILQMNPDLDASQALENGTEIRLPAGSHVPSSRISTAPENAPPPTEGAITDTTAATGAKQYTVQANDGMWNVAEALLGDGLLHAELQDMVVGQEVAPGVVFTADTFVIHEGWVFTLADQDAALDTPTAAAAAAVAETHTVVAGDTLSEIAEQQLGDADTWPEIFEENAGRQMDDGRTFDDPNLILPGWQIDVPTDDPEDADISAPTPVEGPRAADTAPVASADSEVSPAVPEEVSDPAGVGTGIADPAATPERDAPAAITPPISTTKTTTTTTSVPAPVGDGAGSDIGDERPDSPAAPSPIRIEHAALLAAGVLALVGVRRRQRLRAATPRARVPEPPPRVVATERRLRTIDAGERSLRVDVAIRAAAHELVDTDAQIGTVLVDHDGGIEMRLTGPATLQSPWVTVGDDRQSWDLPAALPIELLGEAARRVGTPCVALVQLGVSHDRDVLIDVEACGTLAVDAQAVQATEVLTALAAGLATSPYAEIAHLVTVSLADAAIVGHRNAHRAPSPGQAFELAASLIGTTSSAQRSTFSLRSLRTGGEMWEPAVILLDDLENQLSDLPSELPAPGRGIGLIAATPSSGLPTAGARLVGSSTGWRFDAFDTSIELTPVGIDDAELAAVAELIDDASAPLSIDDEITWATKGTGGLGDVQEVLHDELRNDDVTDADTTPTGDPTSDVRQPVKTIRVFEPEDHQIIVRLMGGVEVVSHDGRPGVFERSKTVELIAWLATHRSSSTRAAARTALWELDVRDATFANVVSEARRALARLVTPPGDEEWVARTLTEQLPLHTGVVTDADLIEERLAAARLQPPAQAIETLTPAAEMIRDIPFAGTSYLWTDAEGITSNLVLLATGVATELAGHALSLGDTDLVFWATGQGLKVLPGYEELIGLRMQAHARAGDLAGVRQEWESYERVIVADAWSDGEPAPKLLALRHELLTSPA
jgi:nucleoid-associated protein YgaU